MSEIKHLDNCTCGCKNQKIELVHVHVHSDHSNLDGVNRIDRLVKRAKEFGQKALSLNDHGNPSGIFQFYKECKKHDIKPILGLEFYICNDLTSRIGNKSREFEDRDYHQSVFIKNKEGFVNYNYLTYIAHTEGFYYKPRIDFDILFEKSKGLMTTSSCIASKINNYLTVGNIKEAELLFKKFRDTFGDDFYGEIQLNELTDMDQFGIDQKKNNQFIIDMCQKFDVPILYGGDIHYLDPEDNELQDVIINSKRQKKEGEEGFKIHARTLYLTQPDDIFRFNKDYGYNYDEKFLEQCFANSVAFSEKVNFDFQTGTYHTPKIKIESGLTPKEFLEQKTWEGIEKRINDQRENGFDIPDSMIDAYEKRIPYELKVIDDLDLNDYILIVYDIINWEKANNIYVGCGRGSICGSLVAYAIGISDIDPIKHDLWFERFINPNRKVQADIDWDTEQGGRERILEYLIETYGQDSVLNVATFGTFSPKSSLSDISRGLGKDTSLGSVLMKKINKIPQLAEEGVRKWKPKQGEMIEFFKGYAKDNNDPEVAEWLADNQDTIRLADKLNGQMKNLGTHAGGIVVTPGPVYNYMPVTKGSGNLITAFSEADGSAKELSELGILKLDVLGLKTLNVLKECVERIKLDKGIDLKDKINYLPLDDKKMLEYFSTGNNFGIFQMDRSKMFTSTFKDDGAPVDSFDDIVAINAINRPGPLEKYINKYGKWKAIDKGKVELSKEDIEKEDKERYPFEFMRQILSKTYGTLLYQEQLMELVSVLTGMTFGDADSFRRAIAWKPDNPKYHTVKNYFDRLQDSMLEKGYTKEDAEYFLKYLRDCSGYSFNKSHSVAYAYIAWQTLFFKVYYPSYFYAAMLNIEKDTDVITDIIKDARENNIEIRNIGITKSEYNSIAEGDDAIRLGYKIIKGLGAAVEDELQVLELYKCRTIDEVLQKPFKKVNNTTLQNLINLGCFDELGVDRNLVIKLKELYKEPKIEKWFTRKHNSITEKYMPDLLKENFDIQLVLEKGEELRGEEQPNIKLIKALTPHLNINAKQDDKAIRKETMAAEIELLGFQVSRDLEFDSFIKSYKTAGYISLSELEKLIEDDLFNPEYDDIQCYFKIVKIFELLTKTGKAYWQLLLNDGNKDFKVKLWKKNPKKGNLVAGKYGIGAFVKDQWGWTCGEYAVI